MRDKPFNVEAALTKLEKVLRRHSMSDNSVVRALPEAVVLLGLAGEPRKRAALAMFERMGKLAEAIHREHPDARATGGMQWINFHDYFGSWYRWCHILTRLYGKDCPFDNDDWVVVLSNLAKFKRMDVFSHVYMRSLTGKLARFSAESPLAGDVVRHARAVAAIFNKDRSPVEKRVARKLREACHLL